MKFSHAFLLCTLLLGACSPGNIPTLLPTAGLSTSSAPSATSVFHTPSPSPTETPSPVTPAPGPISSIPACTNMKVQDTISADYQIPGSMLSVDRPPYYSASGWANGAKSDLYHFDLSTRVKTFLIDLEDYQKHFKKKILYLDVEDLSVSPDFLRAVYIVDAYVDESDWDPRKSWLEIYDAGTNERKTISWKEEWSYIIGWVNNDYFAIRSGSSVLFLDAGGNVRKQFSASTYPDYSNPRVYEPSTFITWGSYRELSGYSFDSGGGNLKSMFLSVRSQTRVYNPTLEIYNPSLEYVIYTEVKDHKPGVVLYDIGAKQKIIEIVTADKIGLTAFGGVPVWSPNGENVLMLLPSTYNSSEQALFLLDISGKVEQLTTFQVLGPYSWSPDGKFVAFWLANGRQIGILDVANRSLRTFCIDGGFENAGSFPIGLGGLPTSGDLIWLPNNSQLLVEIHKVLDRANYEGVGIADLTEAIFIPLQWNAKTPVWLKQ